MMNASRDLKNLLENGRRERVFSAAVCQVGRSEGDMLNEVVGTVTWGGLPASQETPFDIASVTKPITGLLAMALLERGQIALDDCISQFLPEYEDEATKAAITVGQLLTHTSGLPGHVPLYKSVETASQMWAAIKHLPLVSPPGSHVNYSSQGFMLLGRVLEIASASRLSDALTQHVLMPLRMTNTAFGVPESLHSGAAATENCPWRGRLIQGEIHDENAAVLGEFAGHTGLFSTARDLGLICRAMLNGGVAASGDQVVSARTVDRMTAGHTDHLNLRRGLAWQARDSNSCPAGDLASRRSYGHTGFTGTSIWIDPDLDAYVVLLTNAVHSRRDQAGITHFRRRLHNLVLASVSPHGRPGGRKQ